MIFRAVQVSGLPVGRRQTAAAGMLVILLAAFCASGCASLRDTAFTQVLPKPNPQTYQLAILPPRLDACLQAENLQNAAAWYTIILTGGRGMVATDRTPETTIATNLVLALNDGNFCRRAFMAATPEEAVKRGADKLLVCRVHDFRTILCGNNGRFGYVMLLGPLAAQYWIRCVTLEARLDWEAEISDARTGKREFYRHYSQSYYKTVRMAYPTPFLEKMNRFLTLEATPEFINELFLLDTRARPQ